MAADHRPERVAALRERLAALGLDVLLVQAVPNIRYLTGFTGSAALCLVRPDELVLVTDFRYATQAPREVGAVARVEVDQVNVWERLKRVLAERPPEVAGFEAHVATVRDQERLGAIGGWRWEPVAELVERLRVVKDPTEVAAIRAAAALAGEALGEILASVRVGDTELEVAARLEAALRRRGSEWHPFPTIVASGPRSALPHARTSRRALERGVAQCEALHPLCELHGHDGTHTFPLDFEHPTFSEGGVPDAITGGKGGDLTVLIGPHRRG